jgi:uncharacterized protein
LGLDLNAELLSKTNSGHRSALARQFITQELMALTSGNHTPRLFYWHREAKSAQAEVDFLLEVSGKILPIEIKSGLKGSLKSLYAFMGGKKCRLGVKIPEQGFSTWSTPGQQAKILEIPFYAVPALSESVLAYGINATRIDYKVN